MTPERRTWWDFSRGGNLVRLAYQDEPQGPASDFARAPNRGGNNHLED
jgi:hypothetical protein